MSQVVSKTMRNLFRMQRLHYSLSERSGRRRRLMMMSNTLLKSSSVMLLEPTTITNVTSYNKNIDTGIVNNKERMIATSLLSSSPRRIFRNSIVVNEQYDEDGSSCVDEEEIHTVEEEEILSSPIDDDGRHDEIVDRIIDHFSISRSDRNKNNNSNNIEDEEEIHRRGNVQLPPGWGKTQLSLMALTRMLQMKPPQQQQLHRISSSTSTTIATTRIVMFVTPNLILVDQFLKDFDNYPVLSNIISHDDRLIVASKSNRTEIYTTSSDTISNFLLSRSKSSPENNIKLLVCTYASLERVGEAISIINDSIDNSSSNSNSNSNSKKMTVEFGIFDEAHTMEGISKQTGYGLDDSNIPISYRFFLTATPRNYIDNPRRVGVFASEQNLDGGRTIIPTSSLSLSQQQEQEQEPVRSFFHKHLFGPCIVRRTQQQSVEQNVTVPIKLIVMDKDEIEYILQQSILTIDATQKQNQQQRTVLDTLITTIMNSKYDLFVPFAVQAAFHKYNISHAVSFHSNNNRASTFADTYTDVFGSSSSNSNNDDVSVFNVNSKMSASCREQILNDARNSDKSILTNCKILSTAVDEPHWNLVVMADPVESYVSSRQMIGRASRKAPGKECGYVLIPMPVMDGGFENDCNDDETSMNDSYKNLFYSFQAMVSEDPELRQDVLFVIQKMFELKRDLKEDEFPERILEAFVLPSSWSVEMKSNMMNRAVNVYRSQNNWDKMYRLLLVYNDREGNCNVPHRHKGDGGNLGLWLNRQRIKKKNGTLDAECIHRLEKIGVVWDVLSKQWGDMYTLLVKYKEREGNCNVPKGHEEDGENLGNWLRKQRANKKKGTLVDAECIRRLEKIGVVWDVFSQQWDEMYTLLVEYKAREGNCYVPRGHEEDGESLGRWFNTQRIQMKTGKLVDVERIRRLEELGIIWKLR